MEHFIRIGFWITLFLCQQTHSAPLADYKIPSMKRHVICETDSKFYAPTNVKTQCITNALGCIKEELDGTAHLECSDTFEYKDMAVNSLDNLIKERSKKGLGLTDAKECACERYEEKPFNEFLDAMKSLLQRIHSEPSS